MKYTIPQISEIADQLEAEKSTFKSADLKQKYLGKKGILTMLLKEIVNQPAESKATFGKEVNQLKTYVEELVEQLKSNESTAMLNSKKIDPTAPFDINVADTAKPHYLNKLGSQHPLTQELENILKIFNSMGFDIEECRQLDNDYNMFEALNIPKGHPARDVWDTFWTDDDLIPPAHTSTMQNRILRKYKPPIRVVIPGRCFRNEATDANHEHTLHQIEGVYVDENISLGDMLGTIKTYLEAFFERELQIRVQPAFFPFTEPDMEFMISCPLCNATGCATCGHSGWMEAMGCGMIHPNVLKEAGLDPEKYTGFAWGFGLDRLVMLKHKIEDIRWLHKGDLQFLKQF